MINLIFNIINEIKSYFVPEKVEYSIVGDCKRCGKCCNYMYSFDTYTEQEFKFMQILYPAYKRFYIKGKDEDGNFIFACKHVSTECLCTVYNKRLKMCKRYPNHKIFYPAKMHEGCGYSVVAKDFKDYLK
jgi:Fe-S-cluster containining protein